MAQVETVEMFQGAELPSVEITWKDDDGDVIDFSVPHTFELRIGTNPVTVKTTGITGSVSAPNVIIDWVVGELDVIEPTTYRCQLWARRTSDSKDRVMSFYLRILRAITA